MMKVPVCLLVAVLFFGKVHAQQCYQCSSVTSEGDISALPNFTPGIMPCDEEYEQTTVNCNGSGGCVKGNYTLVFYIEGQGRVKAVAVSRGCAPALDEEHIDTLRNTIDALLPSNIQLVSASGTRYGCTDDLCNSAPATTLSLGALLASLLVSYIALKR